jgi:single-stranded DNA-binding protein
MGRIANRNADNGYDLIIWGKVTSPPKVMEIGQAKKPKVIFSVAYAKGQFLTVASYGNTPLSVYAAQLNKGDTVIVAGTYLENPYVDKHGNPNVWKEIRADSIVSNGDLLRIGESIPGSSENAPEGRYEAQNGNREPVDGFAGYDDEGYIPAF